MAMDGNLSHMPPSPMICYGFQKNRTERTAAHMLGSVGCGQVLLQTVVVKVLAAYVTVKQQVTDADYGIVVLDRDFANVSLVAVPDLLGELNAISEKYGGLQLEFTGGADLERHAGNLGQLEWVLMFS